MTALRLLLVGVALAAWGALPAAAAPPPPALAGEFVCQCGCGLTLATCNHPVCGPRDQMLATLGRLLAEGKTASEIRAAFVASYGEAVLAAPPRRGFNLVAWWGPYAALAAGAAVLLTLAALWTRRAERLVSIPSSSLTPEQREAVRRELERLED
ncbi:MAG: cytochrome c-type biogenesis protein CcmH [Armatimonadota bacterium]|nr:cytochrome c-type biogenesis protein CcmH [Armatimonadota bacterium]MDR7403374.1 cytochrome c-type biogenesis protein CcmH [Armatimonadota bacterium]MDR7517227.1 cytochrome c-type biogenesis protein CcmH [Armatimonadota bacterium]MDR7561613.1 cytochrome c-type biogenesis protein CcmH [Armatimonadota bacterium]MDR7588997.1 cytochrome c-type biogenesis protein CcmH [Armatimonadota bacterium]